MNMVGTDLPSETQGPGSLVWELCLYLSVLVLEFRSYSELPYYDNRLCASENVVIGKQNTAEPPGSTAGFVSVCSCFINYRYLLVCTNPVLLRYDCLRLINFDGHLYVHILQSTLLGQNMDDACILFQFV